MIIKNLGVQVESIWKNLRPMTKKMLVTVMETNTKKRKKSFSYDIHADWELGELLKVLDEQTSKRDETAGADNLQEINDLAKICAEVLEEKTESAEIFIQLAGRALTKKNYAKIDTLSDILIQRYKASEVAEVIRQTESAPIRAIAYESLVVMSVSSIIPLIKDPLYFETACNVLQQQAIEFENEEALLALEHLSASFSPNLRQK